MAENGGELLKEFIKWIESPKPLPEGTYDWDRQKFFEENPELEKRSPFILNEGQKFIVSTESFNRGFDAVISIINKDESVERIFPLEFKSNNDSIDQRIEQQIRRHIHVFGTAYVVLDSHIGTDLIGMPKKFFELIPATIYVKKGGEFIKLCGGQHNDELPKFYTNNLEKLLPMGLKKQSKQILEKFGRLDIIMRKLYHERMREGLGFGDTEPIEFTEEELDVMLSMISEIHVEKSIEELSQSLRVLTKINKLQKKKKEVK